MTSPVSRKPPSNRPSTMSWSKSRRFAFQKFKGADPTLTTQMKSVGEVMAIGRTFKESLQKAIRSLELNLNGLVSRFGLDRGVPAEFNRPEAIEKLGRLLRTPIPERLWYLADAMRLGLTERGAVCHDKSRSMVSGPSQTAGGI